MPASPFVSPTLHMWPVADLPIRSARSLRLLPPRSPPWGCPAARLPVEMDTTDDEPTGSSQPPGLMPQVTPLAGGGPDAADRARWIERIVNLRQWARSGERAPHKPLLMLYALGQFQRTGSSRSTFSEAEKPLGRLLREFGRPGQQPTVEHPFVRLGNDHGGALWTVEHAGAGDAHDSKTWLRANQATGGFSKEFEAALVRDPALLTMAARALLEAHFAQSLHRDICSMVGLCLEAVEVDPLGARLVEAVNRRRDPLFRQQIMVAYEQRCAMCDYDGRLGGELVGLDAAHIRWWAFDGPDSVDNGLCLCSFHHKLLDRGAIGVDDSHRVTVSEQFMATGASAEVLVFGLLGRPIREPQRGKPAPADDHLHCHATQVFRGPSRIPA